MSQYFVIHTRRLVRVDISVTVCLCVCVCLFVRLRISPPRMKLATSNFPRWFIDVLGRESHILGNFAFPETLQKPDIGRIGQSIFVCVWFCTVCDFSAEDIKLAASNFARWFIGILGKESHILANFAPQKPKMGRRIGQRAHWAINRIERSLA